MSFVWYSLKIQFYTLQVHMNRQGKAVFFLYGSLKFFFLLPCVYRGREGCKLNMFLINVGNFKPGLE